MYKLFEYLQYMQQGLTMLLKDHNVAVHIANREISVGEPPYILLDQTNFGYGRTLDYYSVQMSLILNAAGLDDDVAPQIYAALRFLVRFVLPNFVSDVVGEYRRESGGRIHTYNFAIELPWDMTLVGEDEEERNATMQKIVIALSGDAEGANDLEYESDG